MSISISALVWEYDMIFFCFQWATLFNVLKILSLTLSRVLLHSCYKLTLLLFVDESWNSERQYFMMLGGILLLVLVLHLIIILIIMKYLYSVYLQTWSSAHCTLIVIYSQLVAKKSACCGSFLTSVGRPSVSPHRCANARPLDAAR